ncbi:MAG: hypothetical protein QM820_47110 [Minicystis sp.]
MIYSVDQNRFSLASAELDFNGVRILGASSPSFSEELPDNMEYGTGNLPVGRVTGQWKGSGEIDLLLVEFDQLAQSLGDGFGQANFNVGCTYLEIAGDGIFSLQFTGCRINKIDGSNEAGKASRVKVAFNYTQPATWNGFRIFAPGGGLLGAIFTAIF